MGKVYNLGQSQVSVTWEEFLPTEREASLDKAVVYFPGWPLKVGPVKVLRRVGEEFANTFGRRTYLIYSQSEQITSEPMYEHAKAICMFLAERGIESIILVGHSQGGIKAIDTVARLQEMNLGICVEGLILINSSALNNIGAWTFFIRQIVDVIFKTAVIVLIESVREPSLRKKITSLKENLTIYLGAGEFIKAIWVDRKPSFRALYRRVINEIAEGTTRSPRLDQIRVPVVIIQSAKDRSFNTDRILTQGKAQSDTSQLLDDKVKNSSSSRRGTLKKISVEDLFPASPYVRLVRAQKFGIHLLPVFRPKAVAQTSLFLLDDSKEAQNIKL